jgi:hypothetical protein
VLHAGLGRPEDLTLEGDYLSLDLVHPVAHDERIPGGKGYDGIAVFFDRFDQITVDDHGLTIEPRKLDHSPVFPAQPQARLLAGVTILQLELFAPFPFLIGSAPPPLFELLDHAARARRGSELLASALERSLERGGVVALHLDSAFEVTKMRVEHVQLESRQHARGFPQPVRGRMQRCGKKFQFAQAPIASGLSHRKKPLLLLLDSLPMIQQRLQAKVTPLRHNGEIPGVRSYRANSERSRPTETRSTGTPSSASTRAT